MSKFIKAQIHTPQEKVSVIGVGVTLWSPTMVPTYRVFSIRTRAAGRRWRLLESVCEQLRDMGIASADVEVWGFASYQPIHSEFRPHPPESLREWLYPAQDAIDALSGRDEVDFA